MFGLGHALSLALPGTRAAGPSFIGPLDTVESGLVAAWSIARRLLKSYEGSLIRLRSDASGSPEQNIIYQSNGDLNADSATAFKGSDSVFIRSIYAQAGSVNVGQSVAVNQPPFLFSSIGGKPGMTHNGTSQYLTHTLGISSASSVFIVCKPTATLSGYRGLISSSSSVSSGVAMLSSLGGGGDKWGTYSGGDQPATTALASGTAVLLEMHTATNGGAGAFFKNGTANGTYAATAFQNGNLGGFITQAFQGEIVEALIWSRELSAGEKTFVRSNIMAYYGL